MNSELADTTHPAALVAMYGGSGTAIFAGLTTGEWQIVGVIGGLLIGLLGLGVTILFKALHYGLAKKSAGVMEGE